MEITLKRLSGLVLTQGIVRSNALLPTADLRQDLAYRPSDIVELAQLMERDLAINIPPADYPRFTTLYESAKYLKERLHESG